MGFWKNPFYTPPGPQTDTLLPRTARSRLQWVQGLEKVERTMYGYEKVDCTQCTVYGYEKVDCSMCEVKTYFRKSCDGGAIHQGTRVDGVRH